MTYDNITFLSDYGHADEFVGVCKSVIRDISRDANIIDLTHDVVPFDVRAASLTLARSANHLCPGVVLAVVDPGGGSARRAVAIELGDGQSVLVGPDNGLLAPLTSVAGGATRAIELTESKYWLRTERTSFAGRDVFAPVAAHLCNGVSLLDLGTEIDAATLVPGLVPFSGEKDGVLHADVIAIDRFGNVQLNVSPSQVETFGNAVTVVHSTETLLARRTDSYADLPSNKLGLLIDSNELMSLVLNQESAAQRYGLDVGDAVVLRPNKVELVQN